MLKNRHFQKLMKEMEASKKTTQNSDKIYTFRLDRVRSDDRKLPFKFLRDVPKIRKDAMKCVNQSGFSYVDMHIVSFNKQGIAQET